VSNLDAWKARSIFEMELPSGVKVKGHYVDMETAIMGGGFDFSVLQGLSAMSEADKAAEADPEAVKEGLRYKRFVVCACLDEVDGEPTSLTEEDYALIPEEDRTAFFNAAIRSDAPLAEVV
jgi:hypothetical protein